MSQIYLFTGENDYERIAALTHWKNEFRIKHGDENLTVISAKSLRAKDLYDQIASAPFIAEKRLVVVEGIPRLEKDEVEAIERIIHPDVILAFTDAKPDKRLGSTKALLCVAEVKDYSIRSGAALTRWIQEYAAEKKVDLQNDQVQLLVRTVGEAQASLAQEIDKLATFSLSGNVTIDVVSHIVFSPPSTIDWVFVDRLVSASSESVLMYLRQLYDRGESPFAIWNMFLWAIQSLMQVHAAVSEGITNPGDIAKHTTVKFPSARSLLPLAKSMNVERMHCIVKTVTEADIALKTGGIRATGEAPQELITIIDRCVLLLKGVGMPQEC